MKIALFSFLSVLFLFSPAFAVDSSKALHPVLQSFVDVGGTVDYIGSAYGTDGYVVRNGKGGVQYAYVTKEGAVIVGLMFSPSGQPTTIDQLKAFKEKLDGSSQGAIKGAEKSRGASKAEKLYAEVEKAVWFKVGKDEAPYMYMFMNVTCDHCQEFWKDMKPAVDNGTVQLRIIPYGIRDTNRVAGAALLSVDNPGVAWQQFIEGKTDVLSESKIKDGAFEKIQRNTTLAMDWELKGPPFSLYRSPATGKITAIVGRPENTLLLLSDLMAKKGE